MKRISLLLCSLLFLAVLSSCDQRKVLNLPELDELYRDISDSVPEIDSVFTEYGNSGTISITVYYGERYQNIDGKDALLIIKKVRALFMQEKFQRTLLATVCGVSRDDILSHRYGAAPVTLSINDSYRSMEASRYKYFLEAHFFSDEDHSDAGKGYTYDGYSTWTGYRYDTDNLDKEPITVDGTEE